jgi:hypothetical protein
MYISSLFVTVMLTSVYAASYKPGPANFRVDPRSIVTIFPALECPTPVKEMAKNCSWLRTKDGKSELVLGSPEEIEQNIRAQLKEMKE